jgi:DNA-binding SARP family transcriptional activator/pimeloyl-ACP methyl ester carboxylesterase
MTRVDVRLLGAFEVSVDGRHVSAGTWPRRARQLVALLALAPNRRLPRDAVLDALWAELPPDAAAANLHKAAHHARRAFGSQDAIVLRGGEVELWPDAAVAIDAREFEDLATRAIEAGDREACAEAARAYRGELLPSERYEDWPAAARTYLAALHLRTLKLAGRWEEVLAHEPLDEEAHRALIGEFVARGDRLAARYQLRHLRDLLEREELEPAPETAAIARDLEVEPRAGESPVPAPIGYVSSDGVNIAYQIVEGGPADLLVIPGWISHLALDWEEPYWVRWCAQMREFARLVRFDKRGTGLSDRPPGPQTLEDRMRDAKAVLHAAGLERAHVLGWSEGGPLALLLAATHPELVSSLTLYGTQACFRESSDYPWGFSDAARAGFTAAVEREWGGLAFAGFFAPKGDQAFARRWAAYQRAGASPAAAAALNDMNLRIDVRWLLDRIRVPTLVLNRRGDPVTPVDAARDMAARIAGARFVELEGDNHVMWVGDTDSLTTAIGSFISEVEARREAPGAAVAGKVPGRPAA